MANALNEREIEIVGRVQECARIERLLEAGGRLVLVGDAGIGKTTLWQHGVERARQSGALVLAASPVEAEQAATHATLGDLLLQIAADRADSLPAPQRIAVRRALLRDEGDVEARALGIAFNTLLVGLANASPVVVAVDDVQWIDGPSAAALDFALRRSDDVTCLFALRRPLASALQLPVDELDIRPLSVGGIHHLLVKRLGIALPRPALLRIHELAGGNAFYALELARAYERDGRLVVPDSLEAVTTSRLRALPAETRRDLAELALAGAPPPNSNLGTALESGVLVPDGESVRFVHPLLAEAAVSLLRPAERRALHREIADRSTDEEVRVRHLAAAIDGQDAQTAAAIATVAASARSRVAAAELWELAAAITPSENTELVAARRTEAGIALILAGNNAGMALLQTYVEQLPGGPLRARGLGHLAFEHGRTDLRLLADGVEAALQETDDLATRFPLVNTLAVTLGLVGDITRACKVADAFVDEAAASGDGGILARALVDAAVLRLSCAEPAEHLIDRARELDPSAVGKAELFVALTTGRLDEARAWLESILADAEAQPIFGYHNTVANLAIVEVAAGNWARAEALADEARTLGEQIDAPYMMSIALAGSATVHALLGRDDLAREWGTRAVELASAIHAEGLANAARYTLGLLELGLGRLAEASDVYREVTPDGWIRAFTWPSVHPAFDAVEALAGTGDLETAHKIALLAARLDSRPSVEACLAAAEGDLDRAVSLLRSCDPRVAPFRRARESLLLGRVLRQARQRTAAREALTAARDEFAQLGAVRWVERADEELSRLGGRSPAGTTLTASERRVGALVAEGLSNKEIAARLVVTVRTVEAHLTKIYAKLGVRSRTALAAAWKEQEPE